MFDRIAPVYDVMNRLMTAGLDRTWRRLTVEAVVQPGDRVLDACCGTGDLAVAAEREGGVVTGLDFSPGMLERARRKSDTVEWVQGDLLALPFDDDAFDAATVGFGVRNVADLEAGLRELRRVLRPGGRLAILEITQPRGLLRPFFSLWFDRLVPLLGKVLPGGNAYTYLPASVRRFPGAEDLAALIERQRFEQVRFRLLGGDDRRAAHRGGRVSALERCGRPSGSPSTSTPSRRVSRRSSSAPGPRRRGRRRGARRRRQAAPADPDVPLVVPRCRPARRRGRRGRARPHGDARARRPDRRRAAPPRPRGCLDGARRPPRRRRATTCSRARSRARRHRRQERVAALAEASLALARGEALQRLQRHDPSTTVEAYLERCSLKTGTLFEAACVLGGGSAEFGRLLGIAFQIVDDILDCTGETVETGKVPGTDLRDGTPTLPLLLAAREDEVVRAALAGGPLEGALVRVAATGALERSREIAARLREESEGEPRRRRSRRDGARALLARRGVDREPR